jgi:acrylyl-CoA reductase (NADPH)
MAEKARVNADWLVPLTTGLTALHTMQIGTAGLTAMLCVMALEEAGITPEQGDILVTGASGGVGSVAVSLLAAKGYSVIAATGRESNRELLLQLGAKQVITRDELLTPIRALDKQLWAGAVDTVGSSVLAKILSQMNYGGAVAACGLAGGFDLPATVMPFILRNVRLQGVDSVMCPFERRQQAWQQLAQLLPASFYDHACEEIILEEAPEAAAKIMDGQITGRVVIKI